MAMACLIALPVSGCSNQQAGETTATPTAGSPTAPSPGAQTGAGATPAATAAASPTASTPAAEKLPTITRDAVDKLKPTSKINEVEKAAGSKGKLVKDENGKKTYELQLSGEGHYYVHITYDKDGNILEKNIFQK
uniref:PepSY domain-containing protein n=2 Tax=Paenibacillus athensensis TaxID=1967502 RepID=A0A4Y8PVH7_9BACL